MSQLERSCSRCHFFELISKGPHNPYGFCRRHAPFTNEKQGAEPAKAQWPLVNAQLDWCGEFEML